MSEEVWQSATVPLPMLDLPRGRAVARKLRLFACACVRRCWHLAPDPSCQAAVEMAERFAEGLSDEQELIAAERVIRAAFPPKPIPYPWVAFAAVLANTTSEETMNVAEDDAWENALEEGVSEIRTDDLVMAAARAAAGSASYFASMCPDSRPQRDAESAWQASCLREVFGNPFRPVTIDASWLVWNAAAVVKLAQVIYDERELPSGQLDAGRLGALAHALEEAGCSKAEILSHCRLAGSHVRGCWVVDLLLDKE